MFELLGCLDELVFWLFLLVIGVKVIRISVHLEKIMICFAFRSILGIMGSILNRENRDTRYFSQLRVYQITEAGNFCRF